MLLPFPPERVRLRVCVKQKEARVRACVFCHPTCSGRQITPFTFQDNLFVPAGVGYT